MNKKITYSQTGVDYSVMDPLKKLAQQKGKDTAKNLTNFNIKEVEGSRGESAYVWEEKDCYRAFVVEGLGTKNLVADAVQKITGKTYYEQIAQDTIAAIVNDILTVGAIPQVINAYFGSGSPNWFSDTDRSQALIEGWAKACDIAGATWGGGETPGLSGIINPDTLDLAGACIGTIEPKSKLTLGDKLKDGDNILLIESSGIHTNGLSLARTIAENLPEGYATLLPDQKMYGETLLVPSFIYVNLVKSLFEQGIDPHYMVNITGHGWRKLIRANKEFTYLINQVPPVLPIFEFLKQHSGSSDYEMYGNFNMGAGFAIYLPEDQIEKAQKIASEQGFKSWNAGIVQKGPRKVVIEQKQITFEAETLGVR
ncbi:phosphoribosylformylglycinamidine cyclo-ligase [Candidatus Daviesbacteria bacterium]|nr:phosphoribosylformylglycinamidine cyclo-ligase [Candidatus Daviesbacteria bacterium]